MPGTEDFLINPYGLMFDEITASSLDGEEAEADEHRHGAQHARVVRYRLPVLRRLGDVKQMRVRKQQDEHHERPKGSETLTLPKKMPSEA